MINKTDLIKYIFIYFCLHCLSILFFSIEYSLIGKVSFIAFIKLISILLIFFSPITMFILIPMNILIDKIHLKWKKYVSQIFLCFIFSLTILFLYQINYKNFPSSLYYLIIRFWKDYLIFYLYFIFFSFLWNIIKK